MLLRELIDIPEQVHQGDFVLKLTEGVERRDDTLGQYVVTEQLQKCFDAALGLIRSAIEGRASKAAYLHGSFGSGKSHFMAVLTMLLDGYPPVRERVDLAPVVARHDEWMQGRRFLVVPYHMIGSTSMEQAILGGYARFIREHHPDAPVPAVYASRPIFDNARKLRTQLGDERFFAQLNEAAAAEESGWGALGAGWDAARFDDAIHDMPGNEEHDALLRALLSTLLTAYQGVVSESGYVTLDEGFAAISRHARDLGYDALVLFLDELVLWLASRMGSGDFVQREGQKVAKLVEAQVADRPVPIVSFVARQRDLRELVGEHVPGAERLGFADVLKWWEGRFSTITLEDRNLPEIAERRVLRPRDEGAREQVDAAFRETARVRDDVWRTLLTSDADRELFRKTYPFSPAFMKTLVGVSGALQRERTALKVMVQLLVDQRDELELGDLVPVGDLFDVIASGDEPFTEQMRAQFEAARRLYNGKLRPLLLSNHGLDDDAARELPATHPFRTDDRLVKTLLLAALVPEVEPLRSLTAGRLAALNHGTITSPIPGEERTIVLQRAREWAAQVAEIKVSDDPQDPTISVQLTGVDTESILDQARNIDRDGERRRYVREMVLQSLSVANPDSLLLEYKTLWRGTPRSVQLRFGNVRSATDIPDAELAAPADGWKLIIDFPFDEPGHSAADDRARLEDYRRTHPSTRTVCWLPAHFSPQTVRDLGRLVVLEHVLSGERFPTYASHLAPADQAIAKAMLDGQRLNLVERLRSAVEQAYGIAHAREGVVDTEISQDQLFLSLDHSFTPRPPVAASLRDGADALVGQMLAHQYPVHPDFEEEVRPRDAERVYEEVAKATRAEGGRVRIEDKPLRKLIRRVANPLKLGTMHEADFQLGDHWVQHVEGRRAAAGQRGEEGPLTVGRVRAWLDVPQPMGLPRHLQDLVILVLADQMNLSLRLHGGPATPRIGGLDDDMELAPQELPSLQEWAAAGARAQAVFGLPPRPLLNGANVRTLADEIVEKARAQRAAVADLRMRLEQHAEQLGIDDGSDRLRTARAAEALLDAITHAGSPVEVVRALAGADVPTTDQALGTSIASSSSLASALSGTRWKLIEMLGGWPQLAGAARADEFVTALGAALDAAENEALGRIPPPPHSPPPNGVTRREVRDVPVEDAKKELDALAERHRDARVTLIWTEPAGER